MAIHKKGPEGSETPESQTFHPAFEKGEKPLPAEGAETDPLNVEYSLPSVELYVPSDEEGVDATPGWRAVRTEFNPDTMRQETTVVKGDVEKILDTEELDALQLEIHNAKNAPRKGLAERAMHLLGVEKPAEIKHVTVIDPEGNEPPTTINVRHTEE